MSKIFFLFKPLFYKQVANSLNCLSIQLQKVKIYIYIFKYWEYGIQQRGYFHTQVMLLTTPFSLESSSTLKFYCILYIYIYKRFYCKIMNKMFCLYLCVSTAKWFMKGFLFFYRTRTWLTLKTKRLHFGQRHTLKDSFVVMTTIEIQLGQTLKIGNTFSKKTKICGHLRNWTEDLNISNKGITDSKSISITWISEST